MKEELKRRKEEFDKMKEQLKEYEDKYTADLREEEKIWRKDFDARRKQIYRAHLEPYKWTAAYRGERIKQVLVVCFQDTEESLKEIQESMDKFGHFMGERYDSPRCGTFVVSDGKVITMLGGGWSLLRPLVETSWPNEDFDGVVKKHQERILMVEKWLSTNPANGVEIMWIE